MCSHEYKNCARCSTPFECKVGSIHLCQCTTIKLSAEQREYIQSHYEDCLCARCLNDLKLEYINKEFAGMLKKVLNSDH